MGQQQLLLLVLATVIVGLATVAGIQAFDEGQEQATQDALTQRALEIGNDLVAAANKPSQFGGVTMGSSPAQALKLAGYDLDGSDNVDADGAGENAKCSVSTSSSVGSSGNNDGYKIDCGDDGPTSGITVDATAGPDGVRVTSINGTTVGSN
ncbi:hypothetical protein [Salinibacter ruber]|uniref:hypothetical protein n=1 Tax=Salinibacter ruber TaxID=146919 RepID=UPI0020741BDD|nr:hypothetical protein [Salinibacter ruber]